MQHALQATEDKEALTMGHHQYIEPGLEAQRHSGTRRRTYCVNNDRNEDCCRNCRPVFRILIASNKFGVVGSKQETEGRENDNREYRDDNAIDSQLDNAIETSGARCAHTKTMLERR